MIASDVDFYNERWTKQANEGKPDEARMELVVGQVLSAIRDRTECEILDVGCGNGWMLKALQDAIGARAVLYGIEPSSVGASNARYRVPGADIFCGVLQDFPASRLFDLVICSEVIEHIDEQEGFARNLALLLKPNGTLIITTPNGRYRESYFRAVHRPSRQPLERWLTTRELQRLCRLLGAVRCQTTFDLSQFYQINPFLRALKHAVCRLPGGWRVWTSTIDWLLCLRARGLYQLVVVSIEE
jgi:2-polyprenyl-3-methyl-5-hydroxy-6-metoxy-1,4-benzoquinol methylase